MRFALRLGERLRRRRRLDAYRQALDGDSAVNPTDLADMGLKRSSLATVARKLTLT